jgi:uncharacterized membrane protein (UPF0127 family)
MFASRLDRLPRRTLPGGHRVAVAVTWRARLLGLAGLGVMSARDGLLLPVCRSVHTFGMRFALDLVWLGADGRPVRVDRGVPPRRARSCRRARSVVEVPAGQGEAMAMGLGV